MLKLHGFAVSNYYNMTKHALLEKGIPFEAVTCTPSQEPEFLVKSPMGKVPFLETETGILTEANVIIEYLDATYPEHPLFPAGPFDKAKVQQMIKTIELYVEAPGHALVGALFGREVPEHTKESSREMLLKGLPALCQLAQFSPYLCGEQFSAADIVLFYSIKLVNSLATATYGWDIYADFPELKTLMDSIEERPVTQSVVADNKTALKAMTG